ITADDVKRVVITTPGDRIHIVDNRDMPDICAQHLVALAIIDRGISFASAHDHARMQDHAVRALRDRTELIPSVELTAAVPARQAIVEIETNSGKTVRHHAKAVRGTPDNPMSAPEIEQKVHDLIAPVIGETRAQHLIDAIARLEGMRSVRALRKLV